MDLLGGLNPGTSQGQQGQQLTAQQMQQSQDLANILKKEGQNSGNKQFTSPWQVAGQWAQALAGKNKQNQINQGSQALNAQNQPGPVQGATPQAAPGGGGAPMVPGQSPAAPGGDMPWSGAPAASSLAPDAMGADAGVAGGMMDAGIGAGSMDMGGMGLAALFA